MFYKYFATDEDPTFTESSFKTKVDNIFVMLHMSLMTDNMKRVDHFIGDEVYKEFNDPSKNVQVTGLYQNLIRGITVYIDNKVNDNSEELTKEITDFAAEIA